MHFRVSGSSQAWASVVMHCVLGIGHDDVYSERLFHYSTACFGWLTPSKFLPEDVSKVCCIFGEDGGS